MRGSASIRTLAAAAATLLAVISLGVLGAPNGWAQAMSSESQATGQTGGGQGGGTQGAGGQTTGGQAAGGEAPPVQAPPAEAPVQAPATADKPEEIGPNRFGYDYFAIQRQAIDAYRLSLQNAAKPAVTGEEKPTEGPRPQAFIPESALNVPDTYVLGPGDRLDITVSSATRAPETFSLVVDDRGGIQVPISGARYVVRGQTLAQFESQIRQRVAAVLRNPSVLVSLGELRKVSVNVVGQSYAPGAYQVSATTTVYNVVYYTGGPTNQGSLRKIQLRRASGETRTLDFYRFLVDGTALDDATILPGDTIFIPPVLSRVEARGEVNNPAVYELLPGESVSDLLRFASGIKPTGVSQSVLVTSVQPGIERRVVEVDALNAQAGRTELYDGDVVEVRSLRAVLANAVSIEGPVDQPGQYPVRPGMRVSDLISSARGLLPDASERMDIFRLQPDNSRALIRVNLPAAIGGDPTQNVLIEPNDQLVVYKVDTFTWLRDQFVTVEGAVRSPSRYGRAEGQRVADILIRAGGLNVDAYLELAFLKRRNPDGSPGPIFRVNLRDALAGNPEHNLLLADNDTLQVFTVAEAVFQSERRVEISGAVQRPGTQIRFDGMKVSDLIAAAGGPVVDTFLEYAFLQRENPDGTPGPLVRIDLRQALAGSPAANVVLMDRDRLRVFAEGEAQVRTNEAVEIVGAVQRPGPYRRGDNLTVRSLIEQAGGLQPNAYVEKAFLQRTLPNGLLGPLVVIDLAAALAGDSSADLPLQDKDKLNIYTLSEAQVLPDKTVSISGAVQRSGVYAASSNLTLADLIALAGGIEPDFSGNVEIGEANMQVGAPIQRLRIEGGQGAWRIPDIQISPGALVSLSRRSDILAKPMMITITGAVAEPGVFLISDRSIPFSDILKRAGGPEPDAFLQGAQFVRKADLLMQPNQRSISPGIIELLQKLNETEYRKAEALLELDRLRIGLGGNVTQLPAVIPGLGATGAAGGSEPPAEGVAEGLATAGDRGVQRARPFVPGELQPINGNLNVRLDRAWSRPGSREDISLVDGDVIYIPKKPVNVVVAGAVFAPQALLFEPGLSVEQYVDRAGGLTADADTDAVMIIRANGQVDRFRRGLRVELGDYILVPTKVQVIRFKEAGGEIGQVVNAITSAGITIGILRSLFN